MKKCTLTFGAFALAAALVAPASALDNPIVVDLHDGRNAKAAASATLFQSGSTVLVNLQGTGKLPNDVAVTLAQGKCDNPGTTAFALSRISDGQSTTQLKHPLADIAGKAKSVVVHQTPNENSPALACGDIHS